MLLPLILEQTDRWYYVAVPLGGLVILPFLIFPAIDLVRGGFRARPLIAAIGGTILPLWFIFSNVGWQFRVDRDGIELRAPLNPFEGAGRIAWRDLRTAEFVSKSTRGGRTKMLEVGDGVTTLDLGALPGVPKEFWPAFLDAVRANAPQTRLDGLTPEQWLRLAEQDSQAGWGELVGRRYVLRDGSGKEVR